MKVRFITFHSKALSNKLKEEGGWDGESLLAAPILVLEGGVVAGNHWCVVGKLNEINFTAAQVWAGAHKDLKVVAVIIRIN